MRTCASRGGECGVLVFLRVRLRMVEYLCACLRVEGRRWRLGVYLYMSIAIRCVIRMCAPVLLPRVWGTSVSTGLFRSAMHSCPNICILAI